MTTFNIISIPGTILKVAPESYYVKTGNGVIEIPKGQLDNNPRVPLPYEVTDPITNRIMEGCKVSMVKLEFPNGSIRYALNEKVYNNIEPQAPTATIATTDSDIKEMLDDMNKPEGVGLEFLSGSFLEGGGDGTVQLKELVRHCVGGANSQLHKLRIYLGISIRNGICTATGIDNELYCMGGDFDIEKLQLGFFNLTEQLTSQSFLMCIGFNVIQYAGKTIIRIDVDNRSKAIVLYGNRELYVRIGSCLHRIDDDKAFVDFIKKS